MPVTSHITYYYYYGHEASQDDGHARAVIMGASAVGVVKRT